MRLFTIIFEYGGGTYVRQVAATSPEEAIQQSFSTISSSLQVTNKILEDAFTSKDLAPIESCKAVWSTTALLKDALLLIHVVATDDAS